MKSPSQGKCLAEDYLLVTIIFFPCYLRFLEFVIDYLMDTDNMTFVSCGSSVVLSGFYHG